MLCAAAAFPAWHSQGKHQTVHDTDPYSKLGGQVLRYFTSNSTVSGIDVNYSNAATTTTGCLVLPKKYNITFCSSQKKYNYTLIT